MRKTARMMQDLKTELEKLATPLVAEAITQATRQLAKEFAAVFDAISDSERKKLLALFAQTMLAEIYSVNEKTKRRSTDPPLEQSNSTHQSETSRSAHKQDRRIYSEFLTDSAVPSDVLEQVRREYDDHETAVEVRKIQQSGGLAFADFYSELEQLARSGNNRP